jgi:hypothetical protein
MIGDVRVDIDPDQRREVLFRYFTGQATSTELSKEFSYGNSFVHNLVKQLLSKSKKAVMYGQYEKLIAQFTPSQLEDFNKWLSDRRLKYGAKPKNYYKGVPRRPLTRVVPIAAKTRSMPVGHHVGHDQSKVLISKERYELLTLKAELYDRIKNEA